MILTIKEVAVGRSVVEQECVMTDEQVQDGGFVGAVRCRAVVERLQFQLVVQMSYACTVRQECSRCLREVLLPVQGELAIICQDLQAADNPDTEEGDYFFGERDTAIDLRQSIYDEVMVNLPIKPLCADSCPGIAGYKQDDETKEKMVDPRWDALAKLKEKK